MYINAYKNIVYNLYYSILVHVKYINIKSAYKLKQQQSLPFLVETTALSLLINYISLSKVCIHKTKFQKIVISKSYSHCEIITENYLPLHKK